MIEQIFQVCVIPILAALTGFIVSYLRTKQKESEQNKYLSMIYDTIASCVTATNQTYVNSLKEQGKFDEEAQKIAFNMTVESILAILSDDAMKFIEKFTGDVNTFLTTKIEEQVNERRGA